MLPDAYEVLAAELDRDPQVDWVIGNSLVTAVDPSGVWKQDVMLYDRSGYQETLPYLETCYLSWVGALYRRTIHDRCGYYDPTFAAAGDTEFKTASCLPSAARPCRERWASSGTIPTSGRRKVPAPNWKTSAPWYLHRTAAGVNYAFAGRDPQTALGLFHACLRYRKSYCTHESTDVEYGSHLAAWLADRAPHRLQAQQAEAVRQVLADYRGLDWLPHISRFAAAGQVLRVRRQAAQTGRRQRAGLPQAVAPLYNIFNDNRYEQHQHVWKSRLGAEAKEPYTPPISRPSAPIPRADPDLLVRGPFEP